MVVVQVITNNESRDFWVHDPMQHSNLVSNDLSKFRIEVYRHHCLVFQGSASNHLSKESKLTRRLAFAAYAQHLPDFTLGTVACNNMSRADLVY